jgi:hypothetical protein
MRIVETHLAIKQRSESSSKPLPKRLTVSSTTNGYHFRNRTEALFFSNVGKGKGKGTGKVHPITGHEGPEREQSYSSTFSLTSALNGVGGQRQPRPFSPKKDPAPIVQQAGWVAGPVRIGALNLTPTGIRSPDRPARSESLYRLDAVFCVLYERHLNLLFKRVTYS